MWGELPQPEHVYFLFLDRFLEPAPRDHRSPHLAARSRAGHPKKKTLPDAKGHIAPPRKKPQLPRNLELWAKLISCDFSKNSQNRSGQPKTQTIMSARGENRGEN